MWCILVLPAALSRREQRTCELLASVQTLSLVCHVTDILEEARLESLEGLSKMKCSRECRSPLSYTFRTARGC